MTLSDEFFVEPPEVEPPEWTEPIPISAYRSADVPELAQPPGADRVTRYDILDATGAHIATHVRHEYPGGKKTFIWQLLDGTYGLGGIATCDLPLYGVHNLGDWRGLVVIVEGEKAADALYAAGIHALGTVTGSSGTPGAIALGELSGRLVYLWPDNDDVGRAHMERIAATLEDLGVVVRWITWVDAPAGGDAADLLATGNNAEIAELLAEASARPLAPGASPFAAPENRGLATLSALGSTSYVDDLLFPGRIVVLAAEEGSGKSYLAAEIGIRVAVAGGSVAGTWEVKQTGPVLYLSEMHADDDFEREAIVCAALGTDRAALTDRYWRLPLMTAAGGEPVLNSGPWREFITDWMRDHGTLLLIIDTATGATQVDPWGKAIQVVYADLRFMLEAYPALTVLLVVHVKKPVNAAADKRISDVMGEWGRWCDIVMLLENDGTSLERVKLTVRKRVRRERRIVATKAGGLLIDPQEVATSKAPKVPAEVVVAAVEAHPGITFKELAGLLGVSKPTADRYVKQLADRLSEVREGGTIRLYGRSDSPDTTPPQTDTVGPVAKRAAGAVAVAESAAPTTTHHYLGVVVGDVAAGAPFVDEALAEMATDDDGEIDNVS